MDSITLHLPDGLYRRLMRLADLTHQPVEGLIVQTLSSNLPPLPDDLSPEVRDALQAIEGLDNDELARISRDTFPEDQYARFSVLREKRRDGELTSEDGAELTELSRAADLLTLKKAYAAMILRWRGRRPPLSAPESADALGK